MAEPLAIGHLTADGGECLRGAPDDPFTLEVSVEILTEGRWENQTSVVRCRGCVEIFEQTPTPA